MADIEEILGLRDDDATTWLKAWIDAKEYFTVKQNSDSVKTLDECELDALRFQSGGESAICGRCNNTNYKYLLNLTSKACGHKFDSLDSLLNNTDCEYTRVLIMTPSPLTSTKHDPNFVLLYTTVEGKSYSQRSCCNSENTSSSEKTCSASLIDETLPPTTAGPSEPSPAPTKDDDGMPRSDKINIIIASVGSVAAVLTVVTAVVQMRRESNTGAAAIADPADDAASIDVDFLHYLVSSSVNNGASVPSSVNEGGLVNTSENDNNGASVPPS